ncbi:hypothetical protein MMC31_000262 [Peltigera leucophlebia]|nr:hypothetical protein [Peltigera leucophlebia]
MGMQHNPSSFPLTSTSSIANLIDVLPPSHSYVIATAAFSTFVNNWLVLRVGTFRKAAKVPYPNCYATDDEAKADKAKYLFNCAQRAHANFLEHQPTFLTSLLISGLSYPTVSAGLGVTWSVARVLYAIGYTNPNKQAGRGRMIGSFFWLAELALQLTAGFTGWKMIMG